MAANPDVVGVRVIRAYGEALADLAETNPLDTPVPTCGDWTLADLVWHLGEVQDSWGFVIAERPNAPHRYVQPPRPADTELAPFLREAGDVLTSALSAAKPEQAAWSWSNDHSVAFTLRRQSHEALIHYVDGALAVGTEPLAIDPHLAADGVDEMVDVMFEPVVDGATFEPESEVALRCTDTDHGWRVVLGAAVDPSGNAVAHVQRSGGAEVDVAISGAGAALDLWLWGRGDAADLEVTGSEQPERVFAPLRDAIERATQ